METILCIKINGQTLCDVTHSFLMSDSEVSLLSQTEDVCPAPVNSKMGKHVERTRQTVRRTHEFTPHQSVWTEEAVWTEGWRVKRLQEHRKTSRFALIQALESHRDLDD